MRIRTPLREIVRVVRRVDMVTFPQGSCASAGWPTPSGARAVQSGYGHQRGTCHVIRVGGPYPGGKPPEWGPSSYLTSITLRWQQTPRQEGTPGRAEASSAVDGGHGRIGDSRVSGARTRATRRRSRDTGHDSHPSRQGAGRRSYGPQGRGGRTVEGFRCLGHPTGQRATRRRDRPDVGDRRPSGGAGGQTAWSAVSRDRRCAASASGADE